MRVAKRVGPALMDGEPVGTLDRIKYALGNLLVYGPLRNNPGFTACAWPTRRARPLARPVHLLPLHRHQPQAAVRLQTACSCACSPTTRPRRTPWACRFARRADQGGRQRRDHGAAPAGLLKSTTEPGCHGRGADGRRLVPTPATPAFWTRGHLKIIDRVKTWASGGANDGAMFAPATWRTSSSSSHIKGSGGPRRQAREGVRWSTSTSTPWATGPSAATCPYARLPDLAQKPEVYGADPRLY